MFGKMILHGLAAAVVCAAAASVYAAGDTPLPSAPAAKTSVGSTPGTGFLPASGSPGGTGYLSPGTSQESGYRRSHHDDDDDDDDDRDRRHSRHHDRREFDR